MKMREAAYKKACKDSAENAEKIYKAQKHPFVSTPNNGPCSSCGKSRSHSIHK